MDGRMNSLSGWLIGMWRLDMNEWTNEWMVRLLMDGWMDEQMEWLLERLISWKMEVRWMHEETSRLLDERKMFKWLVGWMDGWMDEWMNGWMDGQINYLSGWLIGIWMLERLMNKLIANDPRWRRVQTQRLLQVPKTVLLCLLMSSVRLQIV